MTVALKVCLRWLQISVCSGLKSRQNILILPQKHWKACFHSQHPIFVMQGFSAVTATKTRLQSRLDISNMLWVSLSPITPTWDCLVAGEQAQGSYWFRIMVSCIIISLYPNVIIIEKKCVINVMHLNHPKTMLPTLSPWKNCLPQNQPLVPKWLGTAASKDTCNGWKSDS